MAMLAFGKLKVTIVSPSLDRCGIKPLCFMRSPWISAEAGQMLSELPLLLALLAPGGKVKAVQYCDFITQAVVKGGQWAYWSHKFPTALTTSFIFPQNIMFSHLLF